LPALRAYGHVGDRLESSIYQRVVDLGQSAEIGEDLRQQNSVVWVGHSAETAGVATERLDHVVEADPFVTGGFETVAGLGSVEAVLDGGDDLQPQLPRDDDALRPAMAAERGRLRSRAVTVKYVRLLLRVGLGARVNDLGFQVSSHRKLTEIGDSLDGLSRREVNIRAGYVYVTSNYRPSDPEWSWSA
jgi:hypothetical protein